MSVMMDLTTMSQREAPRRLRHGALRHLAETLSGDAVVFFSIDMYAGQPHFGHVIAMGPEDFARRCHALAGKPLLEGAVGQGDVYDLHQSIAQRADRLCAPQKEYQDPMQCYRSPWWRSMVAPYGFASHLRMAMYDSESQLIGVVIVFGHPEQFESKMDAIRDLERETRDALLLADMFERPERPCEALYALYSFDGTLTLASEETPRWLDRERREICASRALAILSSREQRATTAMDGMHIQFERLDGDEVCVLVIITPQCAPKRLPTDILSEEQRRIAEFFAVGATPGEVARYFSQTDKTIERELKQIYGLLGVRDRSGLVRALRQEKN